MKKTLIIIFILTLLPLVTSVSPIIQIAETGSLEISYPKYFYVPLNQNFSLQVHVWNKTDMITNNEATCFFHFYNVTGTHICENWLEWDSNNLEFKLNINSENFTTKGTHPYIISCNTTGQTGFVSGAIEVNTYGLTPLEANTFLFFVIGFLIILALIPALLIYTLGLFVEKEFNLKHLITNISAYLITFAFYIFVTEYFPHKLVEDILLSYLMVGAVTNVIFPIIVMVFALTVWKWEELTKW